MPMPEIKGPEDGMKAALARNQHLDRGGETEASPSTLGTPQPTFVEPFPLNDNAQHLGRGSSIDPQETPYDLSQLMAIPVEDPEYKRRLDLIHFGLERDKAEQFIPDNAKYLGHGLTAIGFQEPSGDVLRLQPFMGQRPFSKDFLALNPDFAQEHQNWMGYAPQEEPWHADTFNVARPASQHIVQPKATLLHGNTNIEKLPFAPSYSQITGKGLMSAKYQGDRDWNNIRHHIKEGLASEGLQMTDLHSGNIGFEGGDLWNPPKVIDPGGIVPLAPKTAPQLTPTIPGVNPEANAAKGRSMFAESEGPTARDWGKEMAQFKDAQDFLVKQKLMDPDNAKMFKAIYERGKAGNKDAAAQYQRFLAGLREEGMLPAGLPTYLAQHGMAEGGDVPKWDYDDWVSNIGQQIDDEIKEWSGTGFFDTSEHDKIRQNEERETEREHTKRIKFGAREVEQQKKRAKKSPFAEGGQVPVMVMPGEKYVPKDVADIFKSDLTKINSGQADERTIPLDSIPGIDIPENAGAPHQDSVPMMAEPGGFVVRESEAQKQREFPTHMASGGTVPSFPSDMPGVGEVSDAESPFGMLHEQMQESDQQSDDFGMGGKLDRLGATMEKMLAIFERMESNAAESDGSKASGRLFQVGSESKRSFKRPMPINESVIQRMLKEASS